MHNPRRTACYLEMLTPEERDYFKDLERCVKREPASEPVDGYAPVGDSGAQPMAEGLAHLKQACMQLHQLASRLYLEMAPLDVKTVH
jgi:hypothetical protein